MLRCHGLREPAGAGETSDARWAPQVTDEDRVTLVGQEGEGGAPLGAEGGQHAWNTRGQGETVGADAGEGGRARRTGLGRPLHDTQQLPGGLSVVELLIRFVLG